MPVLSVIMSIYKEPFEWLKEAIESILSQTYTNFEFIIVNDNPSDSSLSEFLLHIQKTDSRIILISNKQNIGLTKSLNKALEIAQGKYIARMDADDVSMPDRFRKQISLLDSNSSFYIVHSNYALINETCQVIKERFHSYDSFDISMSVWNNPIAHSTVMFRRGINAYRSPLYNESYISAQDYELWSFIYHNTNCSIGYIDEVLLFYRHSSQQVSRTRNTEQINNSKQARRVCVIAFLTKLGLLDKNSSFDVDMCFKAMHGIGRDMIPKQSEWAFMHLLFLLYFSLSRSSIKYSLLYLLDSRGLVKYFGIKQSFYILFHPFVEKDNWYFYKL